MRAGTPSTLLVVDLKNQVYKATHAHGALFSGRVFTGGLYGLLVGMLRAVRDVQASHVVVATDSPPYVRRLEFEGYKGDRRKEETEESRMLLMKASQTFKMVPELLDALDIPLWELPGYEYDDACAWAVDNYSHAFDRVVAMSNDSDLYQLLPGSRFALYRGAKKPMYGPKEFEKEFPGFDQSAWVTFLSMVGTHNAVPGIKGVGPVIAQRALRDPGTMRRVRVDHGHVLERNARLITLPHPTFPADPGFRVRPHRFTLRAFDLFCHRYDITPTANMVEALQDLRSLDAR